MSDDPKIDVLFTCYDALKTLDADDGRWVISQLADRLKMTAVQHTRYCKPSRESQDVVANRE